MFLSLSIGLNLCFGCSKELSQMDGSFGYLQHGSLEYPQYVFWLRNKIKYFSIQTLSWKPVPILHDPLTGILCI